MKIGSIVPYTFLPYQSGGQKLIAQFYEFLSKEADIHLIGTSSNDASLTKGYHFYPILSSSILRYINISLFFKIKRFFKQQKIKVILFEHPYYAWLMWLLKKSGFTIVLHAHNIEHLRFRSIGKWWWRLLKTYEKWAFKQADIAFFISDEDLQYALRNFKLSSERCHVVPFGITNNEYPNNKNEAKKCILNKWSLAENTLLLIFSGHYNYTPNINAVESIIKNVAPILEDNNSLSYKILITGKNLPRYLQTLIQQRKDIIYTDYVEDIEIYFKGSDLLLNTVLAGGGVKTKLIEAIGSGTSVISTRTGALGVDVDICESKLFITDDNDWTGFADKITQLGFCNEMTTPKFYEFYYWGNIAKKVINILSKYA